MIIIDKIKEYFLNTSLPIDKNSEFDAELEDHYVGSQNYYRLYYLNYHRIGEGYGYGYGYYLHNVGLIDYPFATFSFPDEITRSDGFKILSYLTDFIEKSDDINEGSLKSVKALDEVLNLERLGFKRDKKDDKPISLFTVGGRILLFKNSDLYQEYIEWYTAGVTLEEIKKIYAKIGIDFNVMELINNKEEVQLLKLKK